MDRMARGKEQQAYLERAIRVDTKGWGGKVQKLIHGSVPRDPSMGDRPVRLLIKGTHFAQDVCMIDLVPGIQGPQVLVHGRETDVGTRLPQDDDFNRVSRLVFAVVQSDREVVA